MPKFPQNKTIRKVFIVLGIILGVALIVYLVITGRHYFTRRGIRQLNTYITSYGSFSPLAVVFLMVISTLIPPLPIPIPLIEMAAGYLFGFWPGLFLIWGSQAISSLSAYAASRIIGNKLFKKLLKNHYISLYRTYIVQNGPFAVFMTRATLSAPFNIVSFLAGLLEMDLGGFMIATVLGAIPEALLYAFVGSIIQHTRLRLWYVFILVILLGVLGPLLTLVMMKVMKTKKKRQTRSSKRRAKT